MRTTVFSAIALSVFCTAATAQNVRFTRISTAFNTPIGIDYHQPSNTLILSANYPTGQPNNLERVLFDGTRVGFSNLSGLTDELKIATVQVPVGGFTVGDVFTGNGNDGEIVRVSADGTIVQNPWVSLPGTGNGLLRGSLYHDRTGLFGGDMIGVTTVGEVWRINSAGTASMVATTGVHLEGLIVCPNDPQRYGPIAGTIIAGAEGVSLMYSIDATGNVVTYNFGVDIEDIDLIPAGQSFFGVNFGTGFLLGAPASTFAGMEDDILLTQEFFSGNAGIFRLQWDSAQRTYSAVPFTVDAASDPVGQWEHVTFAPLGVTPFPTCDTNPRGPLVVDVARPLQFTVTGRDADPLETVTVTGVNLPANLSTTPPLPVSGNPATVTVDWTPTLAQVGTNVLEFAVTDSTGLRTVCRVTVDVECGVASWSNYGNGWPGTGGVIPSLTMSTNPVVGTTLDLLVQNTRGPATFGCLFLGDAMGNVPTMFGGTIELNMIAESGVPVGVGVQALPFTIPNLGALCGVDYFAQVIVFDEGASQRVAFTRGLRMTLGL